jgi:hypothetical protein
VLILIGVVLLLDSIAAIRASLLRLGNFGGLMLIILISINVVAPPEKGLQPGAA